MGTITFSYSFKYDLPEERPLVLVIVGPPGFKMYPSESLWQEIKTTSPSSCGARCIPSFEVGADKDIGKVLIDALKDGLLRAAGTAAAVVVVNSIPGAGQVAFTGTVTTAFALASISRIVDDEFLSKIDSTSCNGDECRRGVLEIFIPHPKRGRIYHFDLQSNTHPWPHYLLAFNAEGAVYRVSENEAVFLGSLTESKEPFFFGKIDSPYL